MKKITKINDKVRLLAACRRLRFEVLKSIGIFWIINNMLQLQIKEPWNTLYKRTK